MTEWQSIDTPPPDGETVLGFWVNGEMHTGEMWEGGWLPAWEQDNEWAIPACWMPLPGPPDMKLQKKDE